MNYDNNNQIKAYMKKEASKLGLSAGATYSTYLSLLLLKRLSQISSRDIVIKGSFCQYVHLNSLSRPILDVDVTTRRYSDIPINKIYKAMYEFTDPCISFDMLKLPYKTKNGVYKIPAIAKIKGLNDDKEMILSVPVDFKPNNRVILDIKKKTVNQIFPDIPSFDICVPSFEEHIAEKLYIIAHSRREDILNTRVKDFYDVYKLHGKDYDTDKFSLYFQTILYLYQENIQELSTKFLNNDFINKHQDMWTNMSQKYEFMDKSVEFAEAVYYTRAVLAEQIQRINSHKNDEKAQKLALRKVMF